MSHDDLVIIGRIAGALAIGAMIGFERTFHGRPAGFRTHSLVCVASALLMIVTVYQNLWMTQLEHDAIRTDPTRMAQGIMTGIGFLGAGVIFKEGLTVRGLTTAASIWITAAIGILAGVGLYLPMFVSVALTLAVLSVFRWIELKVPTQAYYNFDVKYANDGNLTEEQMRTLIQSHMFSIANFSYRLDAEGRVLRHSMTLRTTDRAAASRLAHTLKENWAVIEFRLSPTGD